jgi:hypothetical protein
MSQSPIIEMLGYCSTAIIYIDTNQRHREYRDHIDGADVMIPYLEGIEGNYSNQFNDDILG